jgi:hypothetical protein
MNRQDDAEDRGGSSSSNGGYDGPQFADIDYKKEYGASY